MEKFFKKLPISNKSSNMNVMSERTEEQNPKRVRIDHDSTNRENLSEVDLENLPSDPGLRFPIYEYNPNIREQIRRVYLQRGPCQPRIHDFPKTVFGTKERRFNPKWFDKYPNWLEYSISKDRAYCLCCHLFKVEGWKKEEDESFTRIGFSNWKKPDRLELHVGGPSSSHNYARKHCEDLIKEKQHIEVVLHKQSDIARVEYRARLNASIDCARFLLRQGLAFRGHDESEKSKNQGNFLELLQFLADHNAELNNIILKNAPSNLKLTAPDIQKEITRAASLSVTNAIIEDIGDSFFSILVDESRDVSTKEQMIIILRYVNAQGRVIERFLCITHVQETTAACLKKTIDQIFSTYGLSVSRIRGQGYDGASNMRGQFNGLKSLFLNENKAAHYIHCFAHQLQLALVAVAKNHIQIALVFTYISNMMNIVGASCKRRDQLREIQHKKLLVALENGIFPTGQGQNQEINLRRAGDTRWGSHYESLVRLIIMFSSVIDVLEIVMEEGINPEQRGEAFALLESLQSFEFCFCLHLMKDLLAITVELSQALQRKDQDILNAMSLVKISKRRLQNMRDNQWDDFINKVILFCEQQKIFIPQMTEKWVARGRPRRNVEEMTNLHHFQVEIFYTVIDMQLQELNHRFTEENTELLLCVTSLNPSNSFEAFNKEKIIRMTHFYPNDFTPLDLMILDNQLETYIMDMRADVQFLSLKGIGSLAEKLIQTKKAILYPIIFKLLKLALVLPVTTANVERAFSAMSIIKNRLRNKIGDQWINDILVTYIEKDIFDGIQNDTIIQHFQNMKTRRCHL